MNKNYSSFSQMKGLLYVDHFNRILIHEFKPPIGAIVDLTNKCNLACEWCNSQSYRSPETLPLEHVKEMITLLSKWGVRSVCYAGGGEPTLHKDFKEVIEFTKANKMQVGISTNGVPLNEEIIESISNNAYFCGVSVDAGTERTWSKLKSNNQWDTLMANCEMLNKKGRIKGLDTTYKFLICEDNQYEILQACVLAKELGFKNFFLRPAAFEKIPGVNMNYNFDTIEIQDQIEKCRTLEDFRFNVFGNFGRVDKTMHMIHPYGECRCTPLAVVMCADGYCYLCIDKRNREDARMCKHKDIRKFWNSMKHHEMIQNIKLDECPRCTFGNYNEQIECYLTDTFSMNFP